MKVRRGRSERGQATIEFAIVLPLVLLLVAGMIEFGKGFNYWLNLNHLADEGARWVAVDKIPPTTQDPDLDDVRTYLVSQITTQELQDNVKADDAVPATPTTYENIGVCYRPAVANDPPQVGDEVRVTIKTKYSLPLVASVANFADSLFGNGQSTFGDLTLAGSASVRLEQPISAGSPYPECT